MKKNTSSELYLSYFVIPFNRFFTAFQKIIFGHLNLGAYYTIPKCWIFNNRKDEEHEETNFSF